MRESWTLNLPRTSNFKVSRLRSKVIDSSESFYKSLYQEFQSNSPRDSDLKTLMKELKLSNTLMIAFIKNLL